MIETLAARGILSEPDPDDQKDMLGFTLDCDLGRWRPTWKKLAKFVAAGKFLLRKDARVTGEDAARELKVHLRAGVLQGLLVSNRLAPLPVARGRP